jgi:hypothetical protein
MMIVKLPVVPPSLSFIGTTIQAQKESPDERSPDGDSDE